MKQSLLSILFLFLSLFVVDSKKANSQDSLPPIGKNTFFVEVLGHGGLGTFNYDRIIFGKDFFKVSGRIGTLPFANAVSGARDLVALLMVNGLLFRGPHHLELGIGSTYSHSEYGENELSVNPLLGYRIQEEEGGLFFRASFTPFYFPKADIKFEPFIGFSIGYTLPPKNQE